MANTDQNILREYLISLGFKVDANAQQQFGSKITKLDKAATNLGRSLVGVAVSAQAMVTEFAFRMERLHYASRLAQSSAANLQSLDFAGRQVGIKNFSENVLSLARSIRANPGIQGLVNSLGVKVTGRDMGDVALDIVRAMQKMPPFIRERYGAMFGWSPDDIQLMTEGLDKMKEQQALQKQTMADMGLNMEDAKNAGLEYARTWREILMYVDAFGMKLAVTLMPAMRSLAGVAKEVLIDWSKMVDKTNEGHPGQITAKGAQESGLTVEEQKEIARRAQASPQKGYYDLTPEERKQRGMPESDRGKPWTVWDYMTPDERKARGLAATEAELPKDQRIWRALKTLSPFSNGSLSGGVELSDNAKERIGQDRLKATNPSPMRGWWDNTWSKFYQSRPKVPFDPAAVDAVTEPAVRAGAQPPSQAVPNAPAAVPPVPERELKEHPQEQAFLRQQEQAKGLPPGLLDYIWQKESGRRTASEDHPIYGPPTKSGEVAQGPFQFMSDTAMRYGVQDPQDFRSSASGAASYMRDLLKKYGDIKFASAAYNWGPGNLDKLLGDTMAQHGDWSQSQIDQYVLGHMPLETRKYVAGLGDADQGTGGAPVTINADTKINVYETSSADDTARAIADNQRRVYADVARQFSDKMR